ncbi:MAG: AraC family transcriptional regulator [Romboutsia sp.]|uniref:AraC family transcriptional regulator n=1 Tax=Romboutsia sp. TaxID=1965302 RepID=UPI003F39335F
MFKQTTCTTFECYGKVISTFNSNHSNVKSKTDITLKDKYIKYLFRCENDLYIKMKKGVVLILVSKDSNFKNIESYIMNGRIKLNKNIFYNFIPICNSCELTLYNENPFNHCIPLEKHFTYNEIISKIKINEIYTKFYQEKSINYMFKGEKHYFWEFTFVDRGILYTNIDGIDFKLKQGDFIFYAPNQYHTQYTNDEKSCSYLTVTFDMNFEDMDLLANKVFSSSKDLYHIITNLMQNLNSVNLYSSEFALSYLKLLVLKSITINLEDTMMKPVNTIQQSFDDKLLENILNFIHKNIYENIHVQQLCTEFGVSSSKLHSLFKSNINNTPKAYINNIKLRKSKDLIKESKYTISEISEILGFTSVHYFSKKFKKTYNFSPREYLKSINKNY